MELKDGSLGFVPTLTIIGDIDQDGCKVLDSEIEKLFESCFNVIFLDFTGVTYIDEKGFAIIHRAVKALGSKGWFGLIGLNDYLKPLFENEGLFTSPRIRVFKDRQAAQFATGDRAST